jgi:hypothetical protein
MRLNMHLALFCFLLSKASLLLISEVKAEVPALEFPVQCTLGEDCYLQQLVDMEDGEKVADPFCKGASYNDHNGTDIRVRSISDLTPDMAVLASSAGVVRAVRDGVADVLLVDENRSKIAGVECGNGVLIDHSDGWQTQYCHLKRGSVAVKVGQVVTTGAVLGSIGLSGKTEFPHLEFVVRKDGEVFDPFSGLKKGSGCGLQDKSLWSDKAQSQLTRDLTQIIDFGISEMPVTRDHLLHGRRPALPRNNNDATLVWGWFINLQQGDQIVLSLRSGDGVIIDNTFDPMPRNKATYVAYAGRRVPSGAGPWDALIGVKRNGKMIALKEERFSR